MTTNVGSRDRLTRILIGAGAGAAALVILAGWAPLPELASPVFGVVALVFLVTGVTGTCGLYSLLGVDTTRVGDR